MRVSQRRNIREYSNSRGSGKVISCVLGDSTGDIQLTAFNADAEKLYETLDNDKTYILSAANVTPVR